MKGFTGALYLFLFGCCAIAQGVHIPLTIVGDKPVQFSANQIAISIDGKPANVISIESLRNAHLQYVVLNDQSGRNAWVGGTATQARFVDAFLRNVVTAGTDIGSLVNFADKVFIDVINSTDPAELSAKLVRKGYGGTNPYDAAQAAAGWLGKRPSRPEYRKVLFMFTDGQQDNESQASLSRAVQSIQKSGIPLFLVLPPEARSKKLPKVASLALETGGGVIFAADDDLGPTGYSALKAALAGSFEVTVEPTINKKGMKTLSVNISGLPVSVHAPAKVFVNK